PGGNLAQRFGLGRVRMHLDPAFDTVGRGNATQFDQVGGDRGGMGGVRHEPGDGSTRGYYAGRAPSGRGRNLGRVVFDQALDGGGQLRAVAGPVLHAVERNAQLFRAFARDGIVETHALDEPTVAAVARIGGHEVVERTLLRPATGHANHHHR